MRSAPSPSAPRHVPASIRYSPVGGANFWGCGSRANAVREALSSPDLRIDTLALALAPGVGPRKYRERTQGFGSAAQAFCATTPAGQQARLRDEAVRATADGERCGARLLMIGDADYP